MSQEPQNGPQEPATSQETGSDSGTFDNVNQWIGNRAVPIVIVSLVLAGVATCILFFFLIRSRGGGTVVGNPTPTPFASGAEGVAAAGEPAWVIMDGVSTITGTVDVPITLSFLGADYAIDVDVVGEDGVWQPTVSGEGTASWVYGTIVNYVMGLPDTETNANLLAELNPGDEIVLQTQSGVEYTYTFDGRQPVPAADQGVYSQKTPGITLILLEAGNGERLVATGRFQVTDAAPDTGSVVGLGETTQLGDLQLTAVSTIYIVDRPEIPPGFAFYLVDYQIQNVGLTAIDTAVLNMTLIDDLGNQYALNPAASQQGNFPPLTGFLNANQTIEATAGYQIPLNLNSNSLSWLVTRQDSGAQVTVTLPYSGNDAAAQNTNISLVRADVSPDQTSLILSGLITNQGTQAVVVTVADVSLTTQDGSEWVLQSTNPAFPWTTEPGQTVQFFLTYQLPPESTAVFRVLNQEFLLEGLR
ncbi:MAG: hypothetical protein HF973_13125 [Chloroflexi bacterium]|nr:hypothetical protein [Chloroflexota bacterium]